MTGKRLLTRQPSNITNLSDFEHSTRLFYSNGQVANYNHEQLSKLDHPVAHINARHSSAIAKKISSEDMSGLEPVLFLAKGARVMLTMNLWASVGLCNGATGTIINFIFQNNHQPPDIYIYLLLLMFKFRTTEVLHFMTLNHHVSQYVQSLSHHRQNMVFMRGNNYFSDLLWL